MNDEGTVDVAAIRVERKVVGTVRGEHVQMRNAAAGAVAVGGDLTVTNGGFGPAAVAGDVSITNGGSGPILAAGDVSIRNGGSQSIAALGGATLGERSFVGAVLAPKVTISDGATVLLSTKQALALGAALGVAMALFSRVLRSHG